MANLLDYISWFLYEWYTVAYESLMGYFEFDVDSNIVILFLSILFFFVVFAIWFSFRVVKWLFNL